MDWQAFRRTVFLRWFAASTIFHILCGHSTANMNLYGKSAFAAEFTFHICNRIPGLGPTLKEMCIKRTDKFLASAFGFTAGIQQCRNLFNNERWNCTTKGDIHQHGLNGIVMARVSKEAAFMYAIAAAGIVFRVTNYCWKGKFDDCRCDNSLDGKWHPGGFLWKCGMDVDYGMTISQYFLDNWKQKSDSEALMNKHNTNAGRLAVKTHMELKCRCIGMSGVCTSRICWKELPRSLKKVGVFLKKKYYNAKQVKPYHRLKRNGLPPFLVIKDTKHERPRILDLIYLLPSPNYCERDPGTGSLGTKGRRCNVNSVGNDSCHLLCCGRGYDTHFYEKSYKCKCRFRWCCDVKCDLCKNATYVYTCK